MSTVLISTHLYEKRPLKKPRLGPPDVYPQDPKQKEDELTQQFVKQGYSNRTLQDEHEYGTERNANINTTRFGEYFSAILAKKHELNTFSDTSKKKHVVNKDSALYVTAKTKPYVEGWFKDLASNTKSLAHLSKKVPFFNKKEEIFIWLFEYSVPMIKAQWFLKVSNAHQMAISESNNKSKKRNQMPDPSQEWTASLCKTLKENYMKIMEATNPNSNVNNNGNTFSSMGNSLNSQPIKTKELLNQWEYYTRLARSLFEEGLLDRHDFLFWLLELFEKIKSIDDQLLTLIAPMLVQYVNEFTQSEFLSRHLAFHCARKISQLVAHVSSEPGVETDKENVSDHKDPDKTSSSILITNSKSSSNESNNNNVMLISCFKDIIACSKFRELLLSLSCVIQVITIECPTALVWHNFDSSSFFDNTNSVSKTPLLHGSPLDYLPCEPSNLPIVSTENVEFLRKRLRNSENLIRYRSANSEKKWFFKTFEAVSSTDSVGNVVNRLLDVLDSIDKHSFDKVTSSNPLDTLYNIIFYPTIHFDGDSYGSNSERNRSNSMANKSIQEIIAEDVAIVKLLCEWAVTNKRLGEYRSRIVAKLLERRQNEILQEKDNLINEVETSESNKNHGDSDSKEFLNGWNNNENKSTSINNNDTIPIYQNVLFEFLDQYAPVTEDKTLGIFFSTNTFPNNNCSSDNKQSFYNLVLLFAELIRHDVFSHDVYMRTLISRGHFVNPPNISLVPSSNSNHPIKNTNEDSLTGLLPPNMETVSNSVLMNQLHKSTSSSSLPMFDPLSNNSNLNSNEQLGSNMFSINEDEDKLDEDLDKILQNIKAGQQSKDDQNDILLPDAIESDKEDETNDPNSVNTNSTSLSDLANNNKNQLSDQINATSRHLLYTLHFPLPQEESFMHECNQRHILLYGVSKTKDEARHIVKKVTKEIQKLFNRKSSLDINDNGKVKKHVIKEGFNFENAIAKFQNLSIFDQHVVTNTCASTVLEMLNGVVVGSANHLPLIESIAFLFDLMEIALNVNGLIEFIVQMLRELVEVESVLQQKCSLLARPYCTSIGLYIIGVLNRYHNYVLASTEDIYQIFDGLWKLVRHVSTPNDCSSAERCIFFYLDDLYSSCACVLKKYQDIINPISQKIKSMIVIRDDNKKESLNHPCVMMQYLKNPREKVDSIHIRQLNENASDRYSLVFNAIRCITEANDMDYLNELSVLCAELTASCWLLSNEWFDAIQALCIPKCTNDYSSLLTQINIGDRSIYDNLAVFVSILVARRCFSLVDLIYRVFIRSLLTPTVESGEETERKARLCCHLILYLFKYYDSPLAASNSAMNSSFASSSRYSLTSPGPLGLSTVAPTLGSGQKSPFNIKYACDRYLLGGALNSLQLELILTLLKAIMRLGTQEKKSCEKNFKSDKSEFDSFYKPINNEDEFNDRTYLNQMAKSKIDSTEKPSLSDFAKYVLRQVCLQDWVHDRCLRGFMIHPNTVKKLFDKKISYEDSQCLLNMICYHKQILPPPVNINEKIDSKQIINIFQNLDEWSLRISWLQLHLIYENLANNSQSPQSNYEWLDTLASAIVEYFQQSCQFEPVLNSKNLTIFTSKSSNIKTNLLHFGNNISNERIWLLKPLISKLPLQNKILRFAAIKFDSPSWILYSQNQSGSMSSKSKFGFQGSKNTNNLAGISLNNLNPTTTLLSYQPFVSLLLMCLNSKEDHKELILKSMHSQLLQCINEKLSDDIRSKSFIQEGLQLRLSLIGAIFDTIKSSTSLTNDWVVLLAQMISFTIVDPHINYVNFSTVLDMLTSLMHYSHASNVLPEQREEIKKLNQNLIRKLKKELNVERVGVGVRMARQLLPLVKYQSEVIACEAMGSLVDTKGNKIAGFDSIDKKQGFQASGKQKLSPWDLIEGVKNYVPISWTWFGAIKMERKPLRLEENFCLLARHDHDMCKPISYYIESPPIPPEDEPPQLPAQPQLPPQQIMSQNPLPPPQLGYNQAHPVISPNGSNISSVGQPTGPPPPPSSNLMNSIPPQPHPPFNSIPPQSATHHQLHQGPPGGPPNMGQSGFQYHVNSMAMSSNNISHGSMQGPAGPTGTSLPSNVMHSSPIVQQVPTQQPPPHMMNSSNNEPTSHMNPQNHPMMMASLNNSSMMPMQMDMMDMPPSGPPNLNRSMPGLRPSMTPSNLPMPSMPAMNTRAQTPKKPKTTRKRRNAKNQQAVNIPPIPSQPTPPIRMSNSFDNYNSNSVNSNQNAPTNWAYQNQNPQQSNMNSNTQSFYHQSGSGPVPNQTGSSMMIPQQATNQRFQGQVIQPKERLRAMLHHRHPNPNQFNMNQNEPPATNVANSGSMMNNQQPTGQMFPSRHQMPAMMQKTQIRAQGPQPQNNHSMTNQNNIFQQQQQQQQQQPPPPAPQQQLNQVNPGSMHHHMQQSSNFRPSPSVQNVQFNNNMQSMDNSMSLSTNPNYQQPASNSQQQNMMIRPQMAMNSQQQNQGQFMQQRSQFSNYAGHQVPSQSQQQQQTQQPQQQQMMNNWQGNQMGQNHPRAPMTQLQRQLSTPNPGQLQSSYPY
ncbi:mediator of RNA polymerase II transcription subunit 12-like protein [Dermatophagoides pteronyssinus]|uniref:mediator of RNA polymerase II transcription subunit 12-like protein n=1 Tax=Dermatophagoides pteronyssinus TaxID=6956 RepID=UPI003F6702E4